MFNGTRTRAIQMFLVVVISGVNHYGCGAELANEANQLNWGEATEEFVLGRSSTPPLRTIHLTLAPKRVKRYRVKATEFMASLTQSGDAIAKLSARHYEIELQSETGLEPELVATADEPRMRHWTLRVHNLSDTPLEATIVITAVPEVQDTPAVNVPESLHSEVIFSPGTYGDTHLTRIVSALNTATESIDIAMYSFSDASTQRAVADAIGRGVAVRMLFEDAHKDFRSPADTRSARFEELGVDVRYVNRIMHHKFAIIDGPQDEDDLADQATLITGSGNWSWGAAHRYDENTVLVSGHGPLVLSFQREFNHLWGNSRDLVWNEELEYIETLPVDDEHTLDLERDGVATFFTSDNFRTYHSSRYGNTFGTIPERSTIADSVVALIESAQDSILIASGHMRSRAIAEALIAKQEANPEMEIRVYLDGQEFINISTHWRQTLKLNECLDRAGSSASKARRCHNRGYYFGYALQLADVDLRFKHYAFRWDYSYAVQMHHKYIIIDREVVASGSYNFSDNAEHNTFENIVLYKSTHFPELVQGFVDNFESIWTTGEGLLEPLLQTIEGSDEFPIVYDSMALSWSDVYRLKTLILNHCDEIYSDEFRRNPTEHLTCVKSP